MYAAILLIELSLPVAADEPKRTGLYIGSGMGPNFLSGETLADPGSASLGTGFTGLGSIGWAFPFGLRAEIGLDYRQNPVT